MLRFFFFVCRKLKPVLANIVSDERCDVHLMVLGIRDEKEGWLHLYCPGGVACEDDGELWSKMVSLQLLLLSLLFYSKLNAFKF